MKKGKLSVIIASILVCSLVMSQGVYVWAAEGNNSDVIRVSRDVRLQEDFYSATNRDLLNNAKFEDGKSYGLGFGSSARKIRDEDIKALINDLLASEKRYSANSDEKKIINLYKNVLNTEERNKQGIQPIKKMLSDIKNINTIDDLTKSYSNHKISNYLVQFVCNVADRKDSTKYALYIDPTTLSLGNSDEYLIPTQESERKKKLTEDYYINILKLTGYTEEVAKKKVGNLFKFENMITPAILGENESQSRSNILEDMYNVYTLDQLDTLAPNLNLKEIMNELKIDNTNRIIVEQPKWLKALNDVYTKENLPLLKDYLEIMSISDSSDYLSDDFQNASTKYINECYGGQGEISKEEQGMNTVKEFLGMPLGKIYIQKYFSEKSKADVKEMTNEIIENYKKRINNIDWMSNETKKNAMEKLNKLTVQIGYPDKWDDYSKLEVKSYAEGGSLWENANEINNFNIENQRSKVNKSIDRTKFPMNPQTINACYTPETNTITVPAGILQGNIYDPNASKEANLGGIGTVIAHEISHAFDSDGAKYDADGNLKNWWTDEDSKKFEEKTNKVVNFYNQIKMENGENINGTLTLRENTADISGVACILDLMKEIPNSDYKAFFENYTHIYCEIYTKEELENMLKYDNHAPYKARVNAVLSQFEEFYKTYGIKEGDKMYVKPEDRLKIW